ncbi:Ras GTPase-activating IQGAP1, partial [Paramuricea clavata]
MRKELEKYGIQMPAFSKIGGILESEMPVDEAALHAAIIVINEAIDHGIAKETFEALRNPNAHLTDLDVKNMDEYQDLLYKAKGSKCQTALLRSPGSEDVYDKMLTQAEVQGNIAMANEIVRKKDLDNAVAEINAAVDSEDLNRLLKALLNDRAKLNKVIAENGDWYQQTLSEVKQGKGNVPLTHAEILEGIINANTIGEQFKILETIMKSLNKALEAGNVYECHSLLMKPEALLPTVLNRSAYLYYNELSKEKKKKQQSGHSANLTHGEVTEHIKVLTAIASINQAIEQGNASELWKCLKHESAKLENIEDDAVNRYLEQLVAVKKEKGQDCGQGKDDLNQVELQLCIDYVNTEVSEEHALITAVQAINRTIEEDNPAATLTSLQQDPAKLKNILPENALLYQALLYAEKQEKKKKTDDPSAELWHDEIQRIIDKCNLYAIDARKRYERYNAIRADPCLIFLKKCGPPTSSDEATTGDAIDGEGLREEDENNDDPDYQLPQDRKNEDVESDDDVDFDMEGKESRPVVKEEVKVEKPPPVVEGSQTNPASTSNFLPWPSPSDLNTRLRRIVAGFQRILRKEELKRVAVEKENRRKEKVEEAVRQKELKKAEQAQKWSKREEVDFYRCVSTYGVHINPTTQEYDWSKF